MKYQSNLKVRERIVACHQPNFLPWLGFFAKMAKADIFILLDDVQFIRGHHNQNWTTRVRMLNANGPFWLSMPVCRTGRGLQKIKELKTDNSDQRWLKKMTRTIDQTYKNTPYYKDVIPPIIELFKQHSGFVCCTNLQLIKCINQMLDLKTPLLMSSQMNINKFGTERLIKLTQSAKGNCYLSGDGADDYQEIEKFKSLGITLRKLGFIHPEYQQHIKGEFTSGLTILDALCNIGAAGTREMLIASAQGEKYV